MPRHELQLIHKLLSDDDCPLDLDQQFELVQSVRKTLSAEEAGQLDRLFLERCLHFRRGLGEAQEGIEKCQAVLDKLTAPPLFAATFRYLRTTPAGVQAIIDIGQGRTAVGIGDDVDPASLALGDQVLLSHERNIILARLDEGPPRHGATARFARWTADGRMVVAIRDEEPILEATGALKKSELKEGDQIHIDLGIGIAYEKIDRPNDGRQYLLDEVSNLRAAQVGGQRAAVGTILAALTSSLLAPERAKAYGVLGKRGILMVGPPGCGKTLIARLAASELARISGRRCRFGVVKPGEFEDPFVGMTQRNIRNCFAALREAAHDAMAVLFFDEIETIARTRGLMANHHSDEFLGALLAEFDGFDANSNVSIIAASNRKDLIDQAILSRMGTEVVVGRPDKRGAREIFAIHLGASIPYNPNSSQAADTRQEIIETAVSMLYAPNADNELCTVHFRDNKTRKVAARELISGRAIQQICLESRQAAFLREVRGGEPGVTVADMKDAVATTIAKWTTTLTPRNIHSYLTDLPNDVDVVDCRPIQRKVTRPHRYVQLSQV